MIYRKLKPVRMHCEPDISFSVKFLEVFPELRHLDKVKMKT